MTTRTRALAASSPAILGLLWQLWRHRALIGDRCEGALIRMLAVREKD